MCKQIKIFLLIIHVVVVLFLFSQKLYAAALHFIACGDTRQDIKTMEEPQIKHNAIAKAIRKFNPDFILFSGDMVYYNEFDKFGEVITSNYTGDKKIPPYNGIVKKTGAADKPGEQPRYSFLKEADGLKIKFIALNSSLPDDEEQLQWFLGESIQSNRAAMRHHQGIT
ncbi:MAG: hypothetical protein HUU08_11270 [Candidatus Brocadia sp.]|nr:hypothetical protein [Candidatus Brocadia sp.]